jgi:hypothetical protein
MNRLGYALVLAAAAALPAGAASPDPKDLAVSPADLARARQLVKQLGSEAFWEREEAEEALAAMGRLAKPALAEAVSGHPDPEVRSRCRFLLPRATAADLKARLDAFLADTAGEFDHDLPGWDAFRKAAGAGGPARALFARMLEDEPNRTVLMAVGGPPGELAALAYLRKQEFAPTRFGRGPRVLSPTATVPDVATILFAESLAPGSKFVPRGVPITTLMTAARLGSAVADEEYGPAFRAVLVRWMDTRADPSSMYAAVTLAVDMDLKEGVRVAVRLLGTDTSGTYRGQAALAVGQLGGKEHLPELEKHLADEAVVVTFRQVVSGEPGEVEVQVRDVALAAALMLTGQDTREYGLVDRGYVPRTSFSAMYFPPGKREAAFERWQEWRARNPDPGKERKR